ncbi:MAG TPA: hypothetical protein PKC95_11820, partial [Thauera aminoaromatica]|nr:hypothetical protein [Thauera aminoaromatica]
MSAPLGFLRRPSAPASASVAASTASPPSLAALPATGVAIAVAMVRPRVRNRGNNSFNDKSFAGRRRKLNKSSSLSRNTSVKNAS